MAKWELRRGLRYGSEHIRYEEGLQAARDFAAGDIVCNGNVGRIVLEDRAKRILYYDIHEEMT